MTDTLLEGGEAVSEETMVGATEEEAPFYYADGVAGEGDKPEWFKGDKYKSVADQAKAYTELEKRFGGFKGSPENYELPEEVDSDDTYVQMLAEIGQKTSMNQETFGELLELGESLLTAKGEIDREREMAALGDNAQQRISSVDSFLKNNLGDRYDDLKGAVSDAATVELIESIIKATAPAKLPTQAATAVNIPTQADIDQMMDRRGENGEVLYHTSESYRQKVRESIAKMHGEDRFTFVN